MSPEWREKWRGFRGERRAWWSLLLLLGLLVACLPAELLCNSRPLLIVQNGRWFWPALNRYTDRDFGGTREVEPDYASLAFLKLLGLEPGVASGGTASGNASLLNQFDAEPGDAPATTAPLPAPVPLLDRFDDEAGTTAPRTTPTAKTAARTAAAELSVGRPPGGQPAWVLWPPVRYDYATIATNSRTGRDALAAPWRQQLPASSVWLPSSWVDGHYLGTDDRGRDVLARLVYGARVSMLFGLALAFTAIVCGTMLGGLQGFSGGWVDLFGQRLSEIWGSLPRLYLLMILSSILARNIWILFLILNLTSWMGIAAYMRAEFLRARNFDYVRAARALGVSDLRIMSRHILPNTLAPVITFFPFLISGGILALVSLDFLGLGVPSPYPSLGELLAQGQANLQALWISVPTVLLLGVTVTLLTFVGDGVRTAFDHRRH